MMNNINEIKKQESFDVSYAEITYHKKYGYMGTCIWNAGEVKEMLIHTVESDNEGLLSSYMKELNEGKELSFGGDEVGIIFRIASEEDIKNAENDAEKEKKELEAFKNSDGYDKEKLERILKYLGLS